MRKLFIILVAVAFVAVSFMPAMAQKYGMDVKIGGEIGIDTKWTKYDSTANAQHTGNNFNDTDITWDNDGSKIRFDLKKGSLSACFKIKGSEDDNVDVYYAMWDFGAGKLKMGLDDPLSFNPRHLPPPRKSGVGDAIGSGADGITVIFPLGPVTLAFAGYTPNTGAGAGVTGLAVDFDNELPRFEGKLDFMLGPVAGNIVYGWNSYSEVTATNKEYDIDSNGLELNLRYFGGPIILMADIWKDTNNYLVTGGHPANGGFGWGFPYAPVNPYQPTYNPGTDCIMDMEVVGWSLSAAYVLNDMVSIWVGYGEESLEQDTVTGICNKDDLKGYEIAIPINITEFFSITPYFAVKDFDDRTPAGGTAIDEGKAKAYGAYWNIVF